MSELGEFEQVDDENLGIRYRFVDEDRFTPDLWVPTLSAIHNALTFGEQREALATAVVNTGASGKGLHPPSQSRRYNNGKVTYPLAFGGNSLIDIRTPKPRLFYLSIGGISVKYNPQVDSSCQTPYALFKQGGGEFFDKAALREVFDADEELTAPDQTLSALVIGSLANDLDSRHPQVGIYIALNEAEVKYQVSQPAS